MLLSEDDRRCTRAMMHLLEIERDLTCIEAHVRGVRQLLPQIRVADLDEMVALIASKIVGCQQEVFQLSRDGIPSSVLL